MDIIPVALLNICFVAWNSEYYTVSALSPCHTVATLISTFEAHYLVCKQSAMN